MTQFAHERTRVNLVEFPLTGREEIEKRIKACEGNIHSPWSWYAEDVRRLLINLDFLYTEKLNLESEGS